MFASIIFYLLPTKQTLPRHTGKTFGKSAKFCYDSHKIQVNKVAVFWTQAYRKTKEMMIFVMIPSSISWMPDKNIYLKPMSISSAHIVGRVEVSHHSQKIREKKK